MRSSSATPWSRPDTTLTPPLVCSSRAPRVHLRRPGVPTEKTPRCYTTQQVSRASRGHSYALIPLRKTTTMLRILRGRMYLTAPIPPPPRKQSLSFPSSASSLWRFDALTVLVSCTGTWKAGGLIGNDLLGSLPTLLLERRLLHPVGFN